MNDFGSEPATLCEAFQATVAAHPGRTALRTVGGAASMTWSEYGDRVRSIAAGLAGLGVGPGGSVAMMMTNRPEFHLCDTAVMHTGAISFSVYNTNPAHVIAYQLDNADARVVVCERQFLPVIRSAIAEGGKVDHVICLDARRGDGAMTLADLEAAPAPDFDFDDAWRAVDSQDVLTIVYTSGTTGMPKGVEITHANLLASARLLDEMSRWSADDRLISYLPDAHMANRWLSHYTAIQTGMSITAVPNVKEVIAALTDARPALFLGVPRIWVKMKVGLESAIAAKPFAQRQLITWALRVGTNIARANTAGRQPGLLDRMRFALASPVLAKIRAQLGLDRIRVAVSSTAPVPVEVMEFVTGLGIPVCEAWGLTEGTCALTINRPDRIRLGTVGTPVPGTEIRLAPDGEILARGPQTMRGYRKAPEKTAEAIDADGWLHTGDVGEMDADGYLRIVDRKKELIINAAGKNMSPANIENAIIANTPLAGPVVTIGDGRPYNTALITLDPDAVAEFAAKNGLAGATAELAREPKVHAAIQAGVDAANQTLSRVEQIKKFVIVPDVWEPGGEYLTPTTKLRCKPIAAGYANLIDELYR
ncbi:AMP-dependent synthetase/ligase [Nocardia cyriacigeorgica]|uniref:AMP-dependent synthetase/ligase n=1 Tax=Nocardia cyriacigeorgica TaxID=135487 RepID=UPI0024579DE5|nr:long-chain fatty acid--CoA ligase [Nocardia cyriacigeorgica]